MIYVEMLEGCARKHLPAYPADGFAQICVVVKEIFGVTCGPVPTSDARVIDFASTLCRPWSMNGRIGCLIRVLAVSVQIKILFAGLWAVMNTSLFSW